jgi:hypothetical protein
MQLSRFQMVLFQPRPHRSRRLEEVDLPAYFHGALVKPPGFLVFRLSLPFCCSMLHPAQAYARISFEFTVKFDGETMSKVGTIHVGGQDFKIDEKWERCKP